MARTTATNPRKAPQPWTAKSTPRADAAGKSPRVVSVTRADHTTARATSAGKMPRKGAATSKTKPSERRHYTGGKEPKWRLPSESVGGTSTTQQSTMERKIIAARHKAMRKQLRARSHREQRRKLCTLSLDVLRPLAKKYYVPGHSALAKKELCRYMSHTKKLKPDVYTQYKLLKTSEGGTIDMHTFIVAYDELMRETAKDVAPRRAPSKNCANKYFAALSVQELRDFTRFYLNGHTKRKKKELCTFLANPSNLFPQHRKHYDAYIDSVQEDEDRTTVEDRDMFNFLLRLEADMPPPEPRQPVTLRLNVKTAKSAKSANPSSSGPSACAGLSRDDCAATAGCRSLTIKGKHQCRPDIVKKGQGNKCADPVLDDLTLADLHEKAKPYYKRGISKLRKAGLCAYVMDTKNLTKESLARYVAWEPVMRAKGMNPTNPITVLEYADRHAQ